MYDRISVTDKQIEDWISGMKQVDVGQYYALTYLHKTVHPV